MKQIIRHVRNLTLINKLVSSLLIFFQKALNESIKYWPITGSRSYNIANTSIILNARSDDGFVNRVFYKKEFDEKVLGVFKVLIANGTNVIYDIGANIGVFTLLAGKTNKDNFIYSFEPNPVNFKRLQSNIRSNKIKNVKTFKLAIGNESKTILLTKPKGNYISDVTSVYSSHTKRFTDFEHEPFKVNEIKLDDLFNNHEIKLPSLIKLDVELFEYQVLIGAKDIISKSRPIILCELHNYDIVIAINPNLEEELPFNFTKNISIFFKKLNYTAYAIGEFGLLKTKHFEECSNVKNFLFLPFEPKNSFYKFTEIGQLLVK